MDAYRAPAAAGERAVRFTGSWREYLPIAVTNALLIICTLGIYRFWAAARQRRYLWSRTEFIDDTLEWTGTGKEMFLGFLIVIAVLAPFFLFIQFLFPALSPTRKELMPRSGSSSCSRSRSSILAASRASGRCAIACRGPTGTASAAAATIPAGITAANISAASRCPRS